MDLKEYERSKFELAEILRQLAMLAKISPPDDERLRDLFVRLAEDRFNLVMFGRFSRGKTSLMNAILGRHWLPTGIVPLTSVITTVSYGSKEEVIVNYKDRRRLSTEVPLDSLREYVTQEGNPGNVREVGTAAVKLPAEILRRGFYFVDTPGLGSPIAENTRTTEEYLPEADAFILITSYESPLSEEELRILRAVSSSGRRVFVVVNKHDIASSEERREALRYLDAQLADLPARNAPRLFSVSAREGLEAQRAGDAARLAASGIPEFEGELARFLVEEKGAEFLLRFCDRVADLARELSSVADVSPPVERVASLSRRIARGRPTAPSRGGERGAPLRLRPCEICRDIVGASFEFLSRFQYVLGTSLDEQQAHAERGGLCALHTWQYASLASPHGICTGYPALLDRLSESLRSASLIEPRAVLENLRGLQPAARRCVLCGACAEAEARAVASIAERLTATPETALDSLSAFCLSHLRLLIESIRDAEIVRTLLIREAMILERLSEDMRRYATKHDAIRRHLASDEEISAGREALAVLAGLRGVNGVLKAN